MCSLSQSISLRAENENSSTSEWAMLRAAVLSSAIQAADPTGRRGPPRIAMVAVAVQQLSSRKSKQCAKGGGGRQQSEGEAASSKKNKEGKKKKKVSSQSGMPWDGIRRSAVDLGARSGEVQNRARSVLECESKPSCGLC